MQKTVFAFHQAVAVLRQKQHRPFPAVDGNYLRAFLLDRFDESDEPVLRILKLPRHNAPL